MAARGEVAGAVGLTPTPYNTGDSARTRNQPSRQPPGAKTEYRAGVVLAPLPTQQQVESMVQATICRRRRPDASDRNRGHGETFGHRSLALRGVWSCS